MTRPLAYDAEAKDRHIRRDAYYCPECGEGLPTPEALGPHIERHRAVRMNGGTPCPKGCGRTYPAQGNPESREHIQLCDGSRPLPIAPARTMWDRLGFNIVKEKEENMTESLKCDECGKSFARPQGLGAHRFRAHGQSDRRKARSTAPVVVAQLRAQADAWRRKAEELEEIASRLAKVIA